MAADKNKSDLRVLGTSNQPDFPRALGDARRQHIALLVALLLSPSVFAAAAKGKPDFRAPTEAKKTPKAVADGTGGMILAVAEVGGTPEQAFRALTSDEVEKWWKFPGVYHQKDWKADLRVGGRWSVTVELNDGKLVHAWGEFCELNAPNKLVMTRRFDAHPLLGERETTITYRFEPSPHGTLVIRAKKTKPAFVSSFANVPRSATQTRHRCHSAIVP
jgi:uncharacterized protein YndB with AHSA1/START domain